MLKRQQWKMLVGLFLFSALSNQTALADVPPEGNAVARKSIIARPNERMHILSDMQRYLTGIQEMMESLARDDMKSAAVAARSMGNINLYEVRLTFPNKHAVEFRDLAMGVHLDFEQVAKDAEDKGNPRLMLGQIAKIMKKCVYCHATYELRDMAHAP